MSLNSELVTEVRNLLNDPSTSAAPFFTDATILQNLQRAVNDLCIETNVNYRAYEYTHSGASTTDVTFLELTGNAETALYQLKELSVKQVNDVTYRQLNRVSFTDKNITTDLASVNVTACHIFDNTIYTNQGIEADDKILITGNWKKPNLSLNATFPLDTICEDAVVRYAVAMGYLNMTKQDAYGVWYQLYLERKSTVKKYYDDLIKAKQPSAVSVHKKSNAIGYSYGYINTEIIP
jgi:hypothetical protein